MPLSERDGSGVVAHFGPLKFAIAHVLDREPLEAVQFCAVLLLHRRFQLWLRRPHKALQPTKEGAEATKCKRESTLLVLELVAQLERTRSLLLPHPLNAARDDLGERCD
eukprot:5801881-Prymnesium_polylepis.2